MAFPSDANATFDPAMHEATLKTIDMFFGRVMTTDELIDEIREVEAPALAGAVANQ